MRILKMLFSKKFKEENSGAFFDLKRGLIVDILGRVIDLRSRQIRPSEILTPLSRRRMILKALVPILFLAFI